MQPWITPYRQFDNYFVERYADTEISERLLSEGDLDAEVRTLKASPQRINSLSISCDGIDCRLAAERVSYISADTLQYLLPVLIRWARRIDTPAETPHPAGAS